LRALLRDQRGTSTVEFVVLLTCLCVAAVFAWQFLGKSIIGVISGD
jgi:Flp pilus assembly protein TadG